MLHNVKVLKAKLDNIERTNQKLQQRRASKLPHQCNSTVMVRVPVKCLQYMLQ